MPLLFVLVSLVEALVSFFDLHEKATITSNDKITAREKILSLNLNNIYLL